MIIVRRASRAQMTRCFFDKSPKQGLFPRKTRVILGSKYTKVVEMEGISLLGGGFKYFLFSTLLGELVEFD